MKKPNSALREALRCYARNAVWGTCSGCPSNDLGTFPEFCERFDEYDHQIGLGELVDLLERPASYE